MCIVTQEFDDKYPSNLVLEVLDPSRSSKLCERCKPTITEGTDISQTSGVGQVKIMGDAILCFPCAWLRNCRSAIGWRLWVAPTSYLPRYFVSYNISDWWNFAQCEECKKAGKACIADTRRKCRECKDAGAPCAIILPNGGPGLSGYSSELLKVITVGRAVDTDEGERELAERLHQECRL